MSQQALLSYDEDDQSQGQLRREDFEEQTENSRLINQINDSVKTRPYGASDIASGAARGAMGLAQGAATGAANLAQGAATALRNTLGNNQQNHNLHTPLATGPHQKRY